MENAAVWRTESRTIYSIRIRPQYTSEAGQMGSGWTPFLSGLYAVTNCAKVGLTQLGWNLSSQRTHHPLPQ